MGLRLFSSRSLCSFVLATLLLTFLYSLTHLFSHDDPEEKLLNFSFDSLSKTFCASNGQQQTFGDNMGPPREDISETISSPEEFDIIPIPAPTPTPTVAKPPEPRFCNYCTSTDEVCKRYGSFNLARSRGYEGPNPRLKRVLRKLRSGQKIKIGVIGGSVSRGQGLPDFRRDNWSTLYANYVRELFVDDDNVELVELINGSVGATTSEYMETCFLEHLPEDLDLVVIELAINDQRYDKFAVGYENLIRAVLELPNKPAIINLQIMALMFPSISTGGDLHVAVAQYYDTPIVSVRNVLLPHILRTTGFDSSDTSVEDYWYAHERDGTIDLRHLGLHGHRILADLLKSFTARVACEGWHEEQAVENSNSDSPELDTIGGWNWSPFPSDRLEGLTLSLPNPNEGSDVSEYIPRQSLFQKYDHTSSLLASKPFCRTTSVGTKDVWGGPLYSPYAHEVTPLPAPLSTEGPDAWALWSHPQNPSKVWLVGKKPQTKVAFEVRTSALGRIRVTFLRSMTYGLGSAWCWVDDERNKGQRLDGWWNVKDIHTANTNEISNSLSPGIHTLHCEILSDSKDPGGGTEFRLIAVDGM